MKHTVRMSLGDYLSVRDFGANDRPECPKCGDEMYLTKRTPHPQLGVEFELQTFSCKECVHEDERTADQGGSYRC